MAKTLPNLRLLTRRKANVESSQVVTDPEIDVYINEAIKSLYDLVISVDVSYYERTDDFTLAGGPTGNTHALPPKFYKMRGLVGSPDTEREFPIYLRTFAERTRGGIGYTPDGDFLRIWPAPTAAQCPWRLYYVPKAPQFDADFTVRLKTTGPLPALDSPNYLVGPGPGSILRGHVNGAFPLVDGVAAIVGDRLLVIDPTGSTPELAGIYTVTNLGSAGTQWILTRATDYDTAKKVAPGDAILVTEGAVNAGVFYTNTTVTVGIDTLPMTFAVRTLDVTLDNFDEYVTSKAALNVFAKRQMDPGLVPGLLAAAEERVKAMSSMRASEPEQAPIMWAPGRRNSWYDDV